MVSSGASFYITTFLTTTFHIAAFHIDCKCIVLLGPCTPYSERAYSFSLLPSLSRVHVTRKTSGLIAFVTAACTFFYTSIGSLVPLGQRQHSLIFSILFFLLYHVHIFLQLFWQCYGLLHCPRLRALRSFISSKLLSINPHPVRAKPPEGSNRRP